MLYRSDDRLRLRIGHEEAGLDQITVAWSRSSSRARVVITMPSGQQLFEYPVSEALEFDFTANTEPELFDFGLFLANVAANEERASRLYRAVAET